MPLSHRLGAVIAAPAALIGLGAGQAVAAPVPLAVNVPAPPTPTKSLPRALDVAVPYQGQTVCDPRPRPGVVAFAKLMTTNYKVGNLALIGRTCAPGVSEHYDGRAWDWMLDINDPYEQAVSVSVLAWLTAPDSQGRPGAMARRFGIMYIIRDHKMWRAYAPERGWAPYYGSSPHTDHIHFSFTYDGAAGRTSWWTGVATTNYLTTLPSTTPTTPDTVVTLPVTSGSGSTSTVLRKGMTSPAVKLLQQRLGSLPTTGYYGSMTTARVMEFQRAAGLPATGTADVKTQTTLARSGWPTKSTTTPGTGTSVKPGTSTVKTSTPLTAYLGVRLAHGSRGAAVSELQRTLGGLPVTGYFGHLAGLGTAGLPVCRQPRSGAQVWVPRGARQERATPARGHADRLLRPADPGRGQARPATRRAGTDGRHRLPHLGAARSAGPRARRLSLALSLPSSQPGACPESSAGRQHRNVIG